MTAQEILDTLEKKVKEAEARNVPGSQECLELNGRWNERFPGNPRQVVKKADGRGTWILTLDEMRDLRDFLTDRLNTSKDMEEAIGPKPTDTQPASDKGKQAVKRLVREVKTTRTTERRQRQGDTYPWEGA